MVPCAKQLGPDYLGSSQGRGKFVDTLVSTATFLTDQKRLPKVEARATYEDFIQPKFAETALGK
jgi:taurine transport system substrate-binding protein